MQGENSLFMSSHAVSAQTLCTWGTTSVKADILSASYSLYKTLMRSCLTPYRLITVRFIRDYVCIVNSFNLVFFNNAHL